MKNDKIINYLDNLGESDPTNDFIIDEIRYNEILGQKLKNELDENGIFSDKGRINQAFFGYKMFLANKVMLLTKLAMTVQDRGKLKARTKPDAVQMQIEEFLSESN